MRPLPRSIIAGSVLRPAWRAGEFRVEGPDEDALTLAVDAIEALPAAPPGAVGRVFLVGETAPGAVDGIPWAIRESIGEVRRMAPTPTALWEAIELAESAPTGSPPDLVVAVDMAGPRLDGADLAWGTSAGAVRIGEGVGAVVHPAEGGTTSTATSQDPPRHVPLLRALRESTVESVGEADSVIVDPDPEGAGKASVELSAPVAWVDVLPSEGPARPPEALRGRDAGGVAAVSEGAYVPRPTYLDSRPSRWRLTAEVCGACGHLTFPARGRCRSCGREDRLTVEALPRDGLGVVATTVIHPGAQPTEFDAFVAEAGPFEVVIVEPRPDVRLTLQLTAYTAGSIAIGDRVDARLRRLYPMEGEWRYGRKAVPALGSPGANRVPEPAGSAPAAQSSRYTE